MLTTEINNIKTRTKIFTSLATCIKQPVLSRLTASGHLMEFGCLIEVGQKLQVAKHRLVTTFTRETALIPSKNTVLLGKNKFSINLEKRFS